MYTSDGEELINASELARRLNVNPSAVLRYEKSGKITPYRIEYRGMRRITLFRASAVDQIKGMRRRETDGHEGNRKPAMLVGLQA